MKFANDYDIAMFLQTFDDPSTPNLFKAAVTLNNLADWANENSDGWAYWPKPVRSAARLIEALETARRGWLTNRALVDMTQAELTAVQRPIKAFLTRQGAVNPEVIP